MNEKTSNNQKENNNISKKSTLKKVWLAVPILLTLMGAPKEMPWKTRFESEWYKTELATNLQNNQINFQDNDPEEMRSKEQMAIDYIGNNFYVNWEAANWLKNFKIEKTWNNIYTVEFEHEFEEWPAKVVMKFEAEYKDNGIFFYFQNWSIPGKISRESLPINTFLEIDETTHNKYDIRTNWNWKRANFNIVYNEGKTIQAIEKIVKGINFSAATRFEHIDELENTQLTALNNPTLWKEVFKDGDLYYRKLFYSTNWKKFDVTNVYFNPNWKFNKQVTEEKQEKLTILWIDVNYTITTDGNTIIFTITETSKQELIEKVKQDRAVLINMINNTRIIAPDEIFSWLNKSESAQNFQSKTWYLSLNAITWIYDIKLNTKGLLEPLHCMVNGDNINLVDQTWKQVNEFYANYKQEKDNNYKITRNGGGLAVNKIREEIDNPRENLPYFIWDQNAINLIRSQWTLTNYDQWYLNYFNNDWILITKIPCDRQDDGSYEFNQDRYHTKIEPLKLYNYPWFQNKVNRINELIANLWITDAEIRDIFEKSLISDWIDLDQEVVEITNPSTWKSIYYKLNRKFKLKIDKNLYEKVGKRLDFMINRLELAEIINNSHIKWKNGDQYKDFEKFIWWETWIWKQVISPEQLQKFVSWESKEITIRISRWQGQYTDIVYTASGKKLKTRLKSWEWKWSVYLNTQRYTIVTIDKNNESKNLHCWDIIVDPKEDRK